MINNSHQSLISRISENALQNTQQSKQLADKRLSENVQEKIASDKRVENKSRVDLASPNDPRQSIGENITSPQKTESQEIFESYTAVGAKAYASPTRGGVIDIKV